MTRYKFLARGATGPFSGYRWPVPSGPDSPGGWADVSVHLDPCRAGLHLCRVEDLPFWLNEELYTVEVEGPVVEHESFVLAHRARLTRRVDAWGRESAHRFSCDCAWRVRDLTAEALRSDGRATEADRLADCATVEDLGQAAREVDAGNPGGSLRLAGYTVDAASFAAGTRSNGGWAAASATTAFVAATAARVAAGPDRGPAASAAERSLQAGWLADLALADG